MPFDALKGLNEELRRREERSCREARRLLSEEAAAKLSGRLLRLKKGMTVEIVYYENGHYLSENGRLEEIDPVFCFLVLSGKQIFFTDIYRIGAVPR